VNDSVREIGVLKVSALREHEAVCWNIALSSVMILAPSASGASGVRAKTNSVVSPYPVI
jgi:hypothetical protein